jgi:hypothetical protein
VSELIVDLHQKLSPLGFYLVKEQFHYLLIGGVSSYGAGKNRVDRVLEVLAQRIQQCACLIPKSRYVPCSWWRDLSSRVHSNDSVLLLAHG